MKKCKSCQKEIDEKATKCPFCQTDQRGFAKRHPIITGIGVFVLIIIVLGAIGGSQSSNQSSNTTSLSSSGNSNSSNSVATPNSGPSQDDLMKQNNPDIKHLSTLTADYVGQSFTIYVNAKTDNYYNYGFTDENSYYSLRLWDNSVGGDYDGIYGYIDKTNPNSKALVEKILNGTTFLKISASIPASKYEQGSNAFLLISSWEEVK